MPDKVEILGDSTPGQQEPGGSGSSGSDSTSDDSGKKLGKDLIKAGLSFGSTETDKYLGDKPKGSSVGPDKTKNTSSQKNGHGGLNMPEKIGIAAGILAVAGGIIFGIVHKGHKKKHKK